MTAVIWKSLIVNLNSSSMDLQVLSDGYFGSFWSRRSNSSHLFPNITIMPATSSTCAYELIIHQGSKSEIIAYKKMTCRVFS